MISFAKLLDKIVVRKAYGYRYHSFRMGKNQISKSQNVEKIDFCVANNLLNNICLKTDEDFALALASLNLIGSKAKQEKFKTGHSSDNVYASRRKHLFNIIAAAINRDVDVKINSGTDIFTGVKTTIVKLKNIQFSYHIDCESIINYCKENNINLIDENLTWNSNFRMQNGGKELFEFCLHLKNVSNTLSGERPLDYVAFLRESYYVDQNKIEEDYNIDREKFKSENFLKKLDCVNERMM